MIQKLAAPVRLLIKGGLLLLAAVLTGTLLLTLVFCIPSEAVRENAVASAWTINDEGIYYQLIKGEQGSTLDGWTDALMIDTAAWPRAEDSAL